MGYNKLDSLVANTRAIGVAFQLRKEQRKATGEERAVLQQYSGFGGIPYILSLDSENKSATETSEVNEALLQLSNVLLNGVEGDRKLYKSLVKSIKSSSLTAFYTPKDIISTLANQIQQAFQSNGLCIGNFLEPAAGTGGFLPIATTGTEKTAFEKDLVSGLILTALEPETNVIVDGFETLDTKELASTEFDIIASNIPFGSLKIYDAEFEKKGNSYKMATKTIHNYFFLKAINQLKEGGILAFITSRWVANGPSNKFVRDFIVHNTNLITAIRLPDNLFIQTAGIEVGSDLLIVQKHSNKAMLTSREQLFLDTVKENVPNSNNKCESANKLLSQPKYALATESSIKTNQFGKYVRKYHWKDTEASMQESLANILAADFNRYFRKDLFGKPATEQTTGQYSLFDLFDNANTAPEPTSKEKKENGEYTDTIEAWMKEGTMVLFKEQLGTLYFKQASLLDMPQPFFKQIKVRQVNIERAGDYFKIRAAYFALANYEDQNKQEYPLLRENLNACYDSYVAKWGQFHCNDNKEFILMDALGMEVFTIEMLHENKIFKADIMKEPVAFKRVDINAKLEPLEALSSSLNYYGHVDLDYMCQSTQKEESDLIEELSGEMYYNALTDCWEEKGKFLAGNVISKSKDLQTFAAKQTGRIKDWTNTAVKALENVIPEPINYEDLEFNLGERWVPCDIYSSFATELFEAETKVFYFDVNDTYIVSIEEYSSISNRVYSIRNINGEGLLVHALQDTVPEFTKEITKNGDKIRIPDEEAIQAASVKIQEIREKFNSWLDNQPIGMREELVRLYNERFNCYVRPSYNGSAQTFPALSFEQLKYKELYPSQKDAVWMIKQNSGGVCWHDVGAGKTMIMCIAAYEMKRLGLAQKPLIIGLKANIHQIAADFRKAYPNAKILYPGKEDFKPKMRQEIFSKIKNNNWDCILLTHDQFAKIPQSEETQIAIFEEELADVERSLLVLQASGVQWSNRKMKKALEKRQENLKTVLQSLKNAINRKKDNSIDFHTMGIDHILVDEYHFFKNLMFQTRHSRVAGIGNSRGSQRALNLLIAIRDIQRRSGKDFGATFLSGTIIVNALTELYVLFKYLRPQELKRQQISCFDAWAAIFTKKTSDYELNVTGSIKRKERFRTYIKVPELAAFLREITDYRTAEMINLDIPEKNVRFLTSEPTLAQEEMINRLVSFAHTGKWEDLGLNYPAPENLDAAKMLIATDIARKMALDMRMLDSECFEDDPNNKAWQCAAQIYDYYTRFDEQKGTQFVFSDLGTYKADKWNIYQDIKDKLVSHYGIPADEIQFIQCAKSETARKNLFEKMNNGTVRILFGSTSMLGTGVNAQERAVAVHHLDIPWRPADLQQRDGRAVRKGNMVKLWGNNTVDVVIYGTEKTLDAYKFNLLKNKQAFIGQINNGTIAVRRMDEDCMDENSGMNFAEFVAVLSGNTDLLDKTKLDSKIMQLEKEQGNFNKEHYRAEKTIAKYEEDIESGKLFIARVTKDIAYVEHFKGERHTTLIGQQTASAEETGKALHQISRSYRNEDLKHIGYCMGLKLYIKSEYHWTGGFERNVFFVEGKSGLKYRNGTTGALSLSFKNAAEYPVATLECINQLIVRRNKEIARMESEFPTLRKIMANVWGKVEELANLKVERKALQDRIDKSLQETEGNLIPDKAA
jgi:N12 class adenine-specific DNA methylase